MKSLFGASLVIAFLVICFMLSEAARNAGLSVWFAGGAFLSFVAFITYHVIAVLIEDYKALHKMKK